MADHIYELDEKLKDKIKKFRFRKEQNVGALVLKINRDEEKIVLDEEHEDITLEELQEELPASVPRFILLSYKCNHNDGRTSYPLCIIFYTPQGSKPEFKMMYTGSIKSVEASSGIAKTFEVRSAEEMTEEWLFNKLKLDNVKKS